MRKSVRGFPAQSSLRGLRERIRDIPLNNDEIDHASHHSASLFSF
jgi:hypothetical protein